MENLLFLTGSPVFRMRSRWQRIAEKLAESGWSWQHVRLTDRAGRSRCVAEAHNQDGEIHAVVGTSIGPVFAALEQSVQRGQK